MNLKTEKAFKDAEHAARLLGDMKHGIYEIKTAGGISEKVKLEALMGFRSQAEDMLRNMGDSISEAIYEVDRQIEWERMANAPSSDTHYCLHCGEKCWHEPDCPIPSDIEMTDTEELCHQEKQV